MDELVEMTNDVRIEIRVKNNILYNLVYSKYNTLKECARDIGVGYVSLSALITLRQPPVYKTTGEYRKICIDIANHFHLFPEDIFPLKLYHIKENRKIVEINYDKFMEQEDKLLSTDPVYIEMSDPLAEVTSHEELNRSVNAMVETLPKRERDILQMLYGLGKYTKSFSAREVGNKYNVGTQRIYQIRNIALRRLLHPKKSRHVEVMYKSILRHENSQMNQFTIIK